MFGLLLAPGSRLGIATRSLGLVTALCAASLAQAEVDPNAQGYSPEQIKAVSDVLICARAIVQKHAIWPDADATAGDYLEQVLSHPDDLDHLREVNRACKAMFNSYNVSISKRGERIAASYRRNQEQNDGDAETVGTSPSFSAPVTEMLRRFRKPQSYCTLAGPEVTAALGVGLTAGVSAGLCRSSDGRQVLAIGAEAGVIFGVAATLGAYVMETEMTGKEIAEGRNGLGVGVAVGIGAKVGQFEGTPGGSYEVGLGYYQFRTAQGAVKVLPLGTNRKKLVRTFLGDSLPWIPVNRTGAESSID